MREVHRWWSLKASILDQEGTRSRVLTLATCNSNGNSTPRIGEHPRTSQHGQWRGKLRGDWKSRPLGQQWAPTCTEHLLCTRHWTKSFICIVSFNFHNFTSEIYFYSSSTIKENEVYRGYVALTGQYLASGGSRTNPAMSLVYKEAGLHLKALCPVRINYSGKYLS